MGQKPSIPTDLSREVKVIGAGFSRTGTVSFSLALEILLKGPVSHSGTNILLREEAYVRKWNAILDPRASEEFKQKALRDVTAGYVATTDVPAIAFTRELAELYPDAVVICSTREKHAWYQSARELFKKTSLWWLDIVFWPMPTLRYFGEWRVAMGKRLEKIYGIPGPDMDGPQLIEIHEDYVRSCVPKKRLHFFNVRDGWEPLCKILNVPIPDEPFPRANDAASMQTYFEGLLKAAAIVWLQIFAASGVAVAMGVYFWRCFEGYHMV